MNESVLDNLIRRSLNESLYEAGAENVNASDPEWISWACKVVIDNNEDIYNLYAWLCKTVAKRQAKGAPVYLEHLAQCSTMKKIVSRAFHDNDINVRKHPEDFKRVAIETAKRIIDSCTDEI